MGPRVEGGRSGVEAIRLEEIAQADNDADLRALAGAFNDALRSSPPDESSGMVEMQAWFAKLRYPGRRERRCSAQERA